MAGTVPACVSQWYNTEAEANTCRDQAQQATGDPYAVEQSASTAIASGPRFRDSYLYPSWATHHYREVDKYRIVDERCGPDPFVEGEERCHAITPYTLTWTHTEYFYQWPVYSAYNALDRFVANIRSGGCYSGEYSDQAQAQQRAATIQQQTGVPQTVTLSDACGISDADRSSSLYSLFVSRHGIGPQQAYLIADDQNALNTYASQLRSRHGVKFGQADFTTKAEAEAAAKAKEAQTGVPQLILVKNKFTPPIAETANPLYMAYTRAHSIPPETAYVLVADTNCAVGARYENTPDSQVRANACAENRARASNRPVSTIQRTEQLGESARVFYEVVQR